MRILFFSESNWSIPAIAELSKNHTIVGVVARESEGKVSMDLLDFLNQSGISVLEPKVCLDPDWLANSQVNFGVSFGYSLKIPEQTFSAFPFGVANVHYGELPKYAGPSPLFWAIKNQESIMTLTVHQIDAGWDAGRLLHAQQVPIFPGESFGILGMRLSMIASEILVKVAADIDKLPGIPLEANTKPMPRPDQGTLTIDWSGQKADEIEALVNASNPSYGGAITFFRGRPVRILEVSPADVNVPGEFTPGTIAYADSNYGVFVICGDKNFLRINIIQMDGVFFSGNKLGAFGVRAGERFG